MGPYYVSNIYEHIICSEVNGMFKGYPCMEAMLAPHKTPGSMKCSLCMATTGVVGGFFAQGEVMLSKVLFEMDGYGSHRLIRPHGTMQGKAWRAVVPFIWK